MPVSGLRKLAEKNGRDDILEILIGMPDDYVAEIVNDELSIYPPEPDDDAA